MGFKEPFAAYNAATNVEAHMVCGCLLDAGIEAMVVEDISNAGGYIGGFLAEIHKPQVWIDKSDCAKAKPVLDDYEQRLVERRSSSAGGPIEVECEECGARTSFPANQNGTTQNCPHCNAYVDVGETAELEGWDEVAEGEEKSEN